MCSTMVACSERQRVRRLLVEAINMLCKTSLKYKSGFSIEGLLGITIDNNQVFLVNIQAEVKDKSWNAAEVKTGQGWGLDGEKPTPSPPASPACEGDQNNGPMDLRTNHHNRDLVTNAGRDDVTNYTRHIGMPTSLKVESCDGEQVSSMPRHGSWGQSTDRFPNERLSPGNESEDHNDVKSEDLTVPATRRNGAQSVCRNNGAHVVGETKPERRPRLEAKGKVSSSRLVKKGKGSPLRERGSYMQRGSDYANMTSVFDLDQDDDDIIFIKDEQDSECSSECTFTSVVAEPPTARPPPVKQPRRRKERCVGTFTPIHISPTATHREVQNTPESCLRTPINNHPTASPVSETLVIDDPVYVKIENDSCSAAGPDGGESSPALQKTSPTQVIYEAGTWAEGKDPARLAQQSKRRARKPTTSQTVSENTVPDSAGCQSLPSTTIPKKRSKKAKGVQQEQPPEEPVPLDEASPLVVDEALVLEPDVPAEEQAVATFDGDQTEWPVDLPRRPRTSYSTAYKLMVVRKAIESGNMRATARRFGIHFKQVWQWTRNKEKLLAMSLSALRSPRLWPQLEEPGNSAGRATSASATATKKTTTSAT